MPERGSNVDEKSKYLAESGVKRRKME